MFARDLDYKCAYLLDELEVLKSQTGAAQRGAAVSMITAFETQIHEVEDLIKQVEDLRPGGAAANRDQQAASREVTLIRGLLRSLVLARGNFWNLASGLLTPAGLTLKGKLGVPFLGEAGVEIKFGA